MGATPPPPSSLTPAWRWRPHRGTVLTSGVEAASRSTRERILEAACDLIAADGIDDVRIARVATRAGASTALVHHYFSTREELLEEALIHSFELAGEERFGEPTEEVPTATKGLARAI